MPSSKSGPANDFPIALAAASESGWLAMAKLLHDDKVLGPLMAGEDRLANFHANTQIPKLIGLARISEVSTSPEREDTILVRDPFED